MKNGKFKSQIDKIVKNKTQCYFISPHLDDAALSSGGLISYLAKRKVPVTVINVFTEADSKPPTKSAKAYLTQSGFREAEKLFSERRKEDTHLFKKIGVNVINLGFVDLLWRKKQKVGIARKALGSLIPEFLHVYPTYRFHGGIGRVSREDRNLKTDIKKKLQESVKGHKDYAVFCPVGIGKHVDHILVRNICSATFDNIIYWSDFNYSMEFVGETKFINKKKLKLAYFDKESTLKKKLIESYKSQIYAIFTHGIVPDVPDFYYM